jgi:hypothetical protein
MPDDLAPVALFAYRRPDHLGRTIEALLACSGADRTALTVFSDGAKGPADQSLVGEVRAMLARIDGFASVRVIERPANVGLARNVIAGVTQILQESERVIVLEDDMVVSPDFLTYMNDALEMYAEDSRVVSIHGYVYPTQELLPDYFFLRGADCWGWATWRRGWSVFDPDGGLARLTTSTSVARSATRRCFEIRWPVGSTRGRSAGTHRRSLPARSRCTRGSPSSRTSALTAVGRTPWAGAAWPRVLVG